MDQAQAWIDHLGLIAHPEGGHFRETYRSPGGLEAQGAIEGASDRRDFGTAIYFLLRAGECSHFHRLKVDEVWHFYAGGPLKIHVLAPGEGLRTIVLGQGGPGSGQAVQAVVPAHTWFAAELLEDEGFALVGCTMAPGFDFADFELAKRADLCAAYPEHAEWIKPLCIS